MTKAFGCTSLHELRWRMFVHVPSIPPGITECGIFSQGIDGNEDAAPVVQVAPRNVL